MRLDQKFFNLSPQGADLVSQVTAFVGDDRAGDDGTTDSASSSQGNLAGNKDIRHVLVLAEQGQVQQNFKWFGIRGHDDEFADASVERLCGLVGTLSELLVVGGLLD